MKTITAQKNFLLEMILIITLAIVVSLTATAGKQERQVKNFHEIEVSGAFNITLTQGNVEKLVVEADADILPKIITEVRGGTLIIKFKNNTTINNSGKMNIELTFINLDGIDLSGAVKLTGAHPLKFTHLEIEGSGASKINLNFTASKLNCDLSGASDITLSGIVPDFYAELSGACNLNAEELKTRFCSLESSGASKAKVNVSEKLSVEGSGATHVSYTGNPASIDSDMSGASKLQKI
jgi:hypothetical protein